MPQDTSVVHPRQVDVPVTGGVHVVTVRPWTMAQRARLKPVLTSLIERVSKLEINPDQLTWADLFSQGEEEIAAVVQASVVLPEGVVWDDLFWEDLPNLAQAVWETSVTGAGGVAGKLRSVLAAVLNQALQANQYARSARETLKKETESKQSSPASASSPAVGEQTQNA